MSTVPDLQNGVRHPATMATRRRVPSGITFSKLILSVPETYHDAGTRAKRRCVGSRNIVLASRPRRRARADDRGPRGPAHHRRRSHWCRHRARRGVAGHPHRPDREGGLRRRDQLAFVAVDPWRPALSRARQPATGVRSQSRAPSAPHHRTASGPPPRLLVPGISRRSGTGLETLRRTLALRHPLAVQERPHAPLAGKPGHAPARAGAAGERPFRRGTLLGRPSRRRPSHPRHHAVGGAGGSPGRQLRRSLESPQVRRPSPRSRAARPAHRRDLPAHGSHRGQRNRSLGGHPASFRRSHSAATPPPHQGRARRGTADADRSHQRHHPDVAGGRPGDVRAALG